MSTISSHDMEDLEQMYRNSCQSGAIGIGEDELADDEMQLEPEFGAASNECLNLLQSIQAEAQNVHANADAEEMEEEVDASQEIPDPDLADAPDREKFEKILQPTSEPAQQIDTAGLPSTLRDAISRPGDLFNALWRYAVKLRSVPGGCDTGFLPNGQNCRRASRKLNWHQSLGPVKCFFLQKLYENEISYKSI